MEGVGKVGLVKPDGKTDDPPVTWAVLYGWFSPKSKKARTSLESCVFPVLLVIHTSIFVIKTPDNTVGGFDNARL